MKCMEIFYKQESAINFFNSIAQELDPEIVKTMDEDVNEEVWIVYYNPPEMK